MKATLREGDAADEPSAVRGSVTATLFGTGPEAFVPSPVELDETLLGDGDASQSVATPLMSVDGVSARRTTVLPRRRPQQATVDPAPVRPRFDRVRVLGEGAMGEVELVRDNDIRRTVAVKRLRDDISSEAALLRFADEVRIVGQLEHPSIVPIYDVGRDESGKIYLVMKHLHGETMEQIIEALRARDRVATEKYTLTYRVHLFLGVLDAIRYAHARGVVHRDLKPANIMIGPYGEVTVLDWGIAKPLQRVEPSTAAELDRTAIDSHDSRLLETRVGSLAGTPLYMCPEQAAGRNDEIDERSDVYSLCVVLYEWLTLLHPLADKKTVTEVLAAIITQDYTAAQLVPPGMGAGVPVEYLQLLERGIRRDPAKRFQSAAALEEGLQQIMAGRVAVHCHVSLAKRATHEFLHWIDRHPGAYSLAFLAVVLSMLGGVIYGVVRVVQALTG